jgi:hypothetical protein
MTLQDPQLVSESQGIDWMKEKLSKLLPALTYFIPQQSGDKVSTLLFR